MTTDLLILGLQRLNEALTAATIIVAASMLFYNLLRGIRERVIRTSSVLLGCICATYLASMFVAIAKTPHSAETWLRIRWIGIAFMPAALFHLSDALLATTGLVSRGRRRRVTRILYIYGVIFLLLAAFTDLIVTGLITDPMPMMRAGPLFGLYLIYFGLAAVFAVNNVLRARRRCLTPTTHRRMTYLLLVFLTPAAGIFPFSLLFPNPTQSNSIALWSLLNVGNLGIVIMLAFMAYPLSFFGSNRPDRVIRAELVRFMLRGPVTAIAVLMAILFVPGARFFGLPGVEFMPFIAVGIVLILQWIYTVIIPVIERRLIYNHDQDQARFIREIGERLLTHTDASQLLEATLAAVCDYLRVPSAFIASVGPGGVHLEQSIGGLLPSQDWIASPDFQALGRANGSLKTPVEGLQVYGDILVWQSFWLVLLRSTRKNGDEEAVSPPIGILGLWARSAQPDLEEEEDLVLRALQARAAHVLEGMRLQADLMASFEAVMQEADAVQYGPSALRYGNAGALVEEVVPDSEGESGLSRAFVDLIRDALRDYWGGPRLTARELLSLKVVSQALEQNGGDPVRAIRSVLERAIESLKPEGARSLTAADWTLYNILEMRFIQRRKVRDVAMRLAMAEATFHRKQNIAIEQAARRVWEMEQAA